MTEDGKATHSSTSERSSGMKPQDRRYFALEDRPRKIKAMILAFLTLGTGVYYLLWLRLALNGNHVLLSNAFWIAEVLSFSMFCIAAIDVWRVRFKPPEGFPTEDLYSVDVFVTACGEPFPVIAKTLTALTQVRWSGPLKVYVLDDGGSPEVRKLANELGFDYLSRRDMGVPPEDAKAGNLNFGLNHSRGELILVLDADQVPKPEIVEVLAGYMKFPTLAFIQSRPTYLVPKGDPFYNLDEVFLGGFQLAMDDSNGVISCGSGVLYRRAALEQIGGFATWNIVEDLTTSYELHSYGWKSFYYPYPLSIGLAPDNIRGVYQQRGQWALDTMRICLYDNPIFKKGLDWRRRLSYLTIILSYFCAGFVFPFFFVIPLWTYLTGKSVLACSAWEFATVRCLYFVCMAAALHYMFQGKRPGKQFQMLTGLFPVYAWNTIRALAYPPGRKPRYKPNNLGKKKKPLPRTVYLLPQLLLFFGNAVMPFMAVTLATAPPNIIVPNAFISGMALWSLWQVLEAAFLKKSWEDRKEPGEFYSLKTAEDNGKKERGAA